MTDRPEQCEVCGERMPVARTGRPRQTCSAACYQAKRRAENGVRRPTKCQMCGKAIEQAARGRVRETCSDRCRQRKRRSSYRWIEARRDQQSWRRAAREVRKMEKWAGSLDIPVPDYPYLTLAKRVQIHLQREESVPWCKVCKRPYVHDTWRSTPTCGGKCAEIYNERQKALEEGLKKYAGRYDPRVDVRLRLGLPIKTCLHCGIPFPDYRWRRKYCSKRCTDKAWYALHPKRKCKECGTVYRGTRKACSARCRLRRWRRTATFCDRCHHVIPAGREMRYEPSYNGPNPEPIRNCHGKLIPFQEAVFCSAKCRDAIGWLPQCKSCVECNAMFYPATKQVQRRRKFCSAACRTRFHNRARTERKRAARELRHCDRCGEALPPERQTRFRYCSTACAKRVPYEGPREKICEHCGKAYPPNYRAWRKQKYCSHNCTDLASYYRRRARAA